MRSWQCTNVIGGLPKRGQKHDPAEFYAAAIYGSILAAAFITVFREEHASPQTVALSVIGTMAVFWIAHVWSSLLGEQIHHGSRINFGQVKTIARAEWPLIEASLAPVVALLLGWIGVIDESKAEDLALAVCVLQLFAWGLYVGHRAYDSWYAVALSGLVNGLLGLLVVSLEISVVH
jgi:hypothetical protein